MAKISALRLVMGAICASAALSGIAAGTANISGYCISERKYFSDEELVDVAVRWVVASHNGRVGLMKNRFGVVISERYETIEEFHIRNPNCCTFTDTAQHNLTGSLFAKLTGGFRTFVRVQYETLEFRENGGKIRLETFIPMSNCNKQTNVI